MRMRKKHTGRNIPFGGSLRSLGRCGQTRYISPVYDGRPDGSSVLDLSGRWASHQERVNRFAARAFGRFFFYIFSLSFPPWLYGWPWPRRHRCHQKFSLSADKNEQFRSKLPVWLCQQMIREAPPTTCPCGASISTEVNNRALFPIANCFPFFVFSFRYRS